MQCHHMPLFTRPLATRLIRRPARFGIREPCTWVLAALARPARLCRRATRLPARPIDRHLECWGVCPAGKRSTAGRLTRRGQSTAQVPTRHSHARIHTPPRITLAPTQTTHNPSMTATMDRNERRIIEGTHAATEIYCLVRDGALKFKDEAYFGGSARGTQRQETQVQFLVTNAVPRSIFRPRVCYGNEIQEPLHFVKQISHVRLKYDDGSHTWAIPIANVIIEYRPSDDVMQAASSERSTSVDGSTRPDVELCVGIPMTTTTTMIKLLSRVVPTANPGMFTSALQETYGGHQWLSVECDPTMTVWYTSGNRPQKVDDLHELLGTIKSNLVVDVIAQMRITRAPPPGITAGTPFQDDGLGPWTLETTLNVVNVLAKTIIGPATCVEGRRRQTSDDLVQVIRGMKGEGQGAVNGESQGAVNGESHDAVNGVKNDDHQDSKATEDASQAATETAKEESQEASKAKKGDGQAASKAKKDKSQKANKAKKNESPEASETKKDESLDASNTKKDEGQEATKATATKGESQ